ncbi:hypothetical protein SAMN05444583_13213 [Rhodococcus maanshanensis]|uniref:Uncharacterized protein n=1 Tax=Rhodococcus maanshanensis TaxID=183556 RepID=A0A1H7XFN8_9NOCA|nr:hypothetical protein SAMN05444583_13213 [Rhodococcus maanshanensis]
MWQDMMNMFMAWMHQMGWQMPMMPMMPMM